MDLRQLVTRIRVRLYKHSVWAHVKGLLASRHFASHGIIVVTGRGFGPRVINRGGTIRCSNCEFYEGVRLEVGPGAVVEIGKGTYLNRNTLIVANEHVTIGAFCKIAWDVVIMDSDLHAIRGEEVGSKPVAIEDNVWIGCRVVILKGVTIGSGAVIAAGAVVTKDIPSGSIAAGVPAHVIGSVQAHHGDISEQS